MLLPLSLIKDTPNQLFDYLIMTQYINKVESVKGEKQNWIEIQLHFLQFAAVVFTNTYLRQQLRIIIEL